MRAMTKTKSKESAKKPATATKTGASQEAALGKIGKAQLVDSVAERAGMTRKEADVAVDAALGAIASALQQGQTVGLPGLGTLSVKATAARTGVRPGTSEKIQIPAGKKVAFKVASTLKCEL